MKRSFVLLALAVIFTVSCKEKSPDTDPTPTFSPTNNNTQEVGDTLGFKTDSIPVKDTSK